MILNKSTGQHGVLNCKNAAIGRVSSFTYHRCNINQSWDHSREIKCIIKKLSAMLIQMKHFLCWRDLNKTLNKRVIEFNIIRWCWGLDVYWRNRKKDPEFSLVELTSIELSYANKAPITLWQPISWTDKAEEVLRETYLKKRKKCHIWFETPTT